MSGLFSTPKVVTTPNAAGATTQQPPVDQVTWTPQGGTPANPALHGFSGYGVPNNQAARSEARAPYTGTVLGE
jgi:hypothetical protein